MLLEKKVILISWVSYHRETIGTVSFLLRARFRNVSVYLLLLRTHFYGSILCLNFVTKNYGIYSLSVNTEWNIQFHVRIS